MDRYGPTSKGGPLFPVGPVGILVEWIAPSISALVPQTLIRGETRLTQTVRFVGENHQKLVSYKNWIQKAMKRYEV